MTNRELSRKRMAMIFNEWAKRACEHPEDFEDFKDEDGNPVDDYGEACSMYFEKLADEMDSQNLLPRPSDS